MEIIDPLVKAIQTFLIDYGFIIPDWFIEILLALTIPPIYILLKRILQYLIKARKYRKNSKDLHPFYTKTDIKRAVKFFIPTKIRDKPPSNFDDLILSRTIDIDTDGIKWFKNVAFDDNDDARFYLVLSDSGMGKTTFMINLYLKYSGQFKRKYDIKLFPIGHPQTFSEIELIKTNRQEKNTILLLDAFDEDRQALENWVFRFDELINTVQGFREVVITSRTQFFPSEFDQPYVTQIPKGGLEKGFHKIHNMYVSPFSESDIKLYLNKKYGRFNFLKISKKARATKIVKNSPSLMLRPMLLAYIDDLLESTSSFDFIFQIYEELIVKWISREAKIIEVERREDFRYNLFRFSSIVAREIYNDWIANGKGLLITEEKIEKIANRYDVELSIFEMKSKSLLNRNAIGEYKFSHKSILEYLLAKECMIDDNFGANFNFIGFDQAKSFVAELSKVKHVLRFFNNQKIKISSRLLTFYISRNPDIKIKRFIKSFVVNKEQLTKLLIKLDDNRFTEGFNELLFQDMVILHDSQNYKIENIKKITTLKRFTLYSNFIHVHNGKIVVLKSIFPDYYFPKWNI